MLDGHPATAPHRLPVSDFPLVRRRLEKHLAASRHAGFAANLSSPAYSGVYVRDYQPSWAELRIWDFLPAAVQTCNWLDRLPADARPSWLWLMLGGLGTETPEHVDVLYSAAWNLLVSGEKEWTFRSPEPGGASMTWTQRPGELFATPSGWQHRVVNIEPSVALTGNFINGTNIRAVVVWLRSQGQYAKVALLESVAVAYGVTLP